MPSDQAPTGPISAVCPACAGRLYPRELACVDCGLQMRTSYKINEFLDLDDDSLHLVRVFIACEGRIRDMERALGVSYPTVKSRLKALRERLGFGEGESEAVAADAPQPRKRTRAPAPKPSDVLDRLEAGEVSFEEAMRLLE